MDSTPDGYLSFDPVASEYDRTRFLPPEIQPQITALIREATNLAPGQFLLDAGVGTGRFALPLAQAGVPVVGVDISDKMMLRLREKEREQEGVTGAIPLRLVRADLRNLPFPEGCFSAALMVHILHLIVDWQRVLDEVQRVLTSDGVLLMASEVGRQRPTRDYYFQLARAWGVLREHQGARNLEMTLDYLRGTGAEIVLLEAEPSWKFTTTARETLEHLRRRTWSNLWSLPEETHQNLLGATEAWANFTYGGLDTVEEVQDAFRIWRVRWPADVPSRV